MKKQILKLFFASFVFTILFTCPIVFAANPTFGVNIQGETSIDAVATIKADVTVNLTDKTTTSTYLYVHNNGTTPIQAKITNIESLTDGAPSTFIDKDENPLTFSYGTTDTESKIGFSITNHTLNFTEQNILPNREIDLGIVNPAGDRGVRAPYGVATASSAGDTISVGDMSLESDNGYASSLFEITPHVGYAWTTANQVFNYGITVVFGLPEESSVGGKTWTNVDTALGIKEVDFGIKKSSSNNYYLVGEIYYDPTKLAADVLSYSLIPDSQFTLVSSAGNVYQKSLGSPKTVTDIAVDENTVGKVFIYPIDLSDVTELGERNSYYSGINGHILKEMASSATGISNSGSVHEIWLS